jgi:O-antigen/teichoic acid export membrane protein
MNTAAGTIHRIRRNAAFVLVGGIVQRGLDFLFLPVIGRLLGVAAVGSFTQALSIIFVVSSFTAVGVGSVAIRELARDKDRVRVRSADMMAVRFGISLALYPLIVLYTLCSGFDPQANRLLLIMGIMLLPRAISGSFESLLIAFEHMRALTILRFVQSVMTFGSGLAALLYFDEHRLVWMQAAMCAAEMVAAVIWWRVGTRLVAAPAFAWRWAEWRSIFMQGLPFNLISLTQNMNRSLSAILLSQIPGPVPGATAVGIYAPASAIARLPLPLLATMRVAMVPSIASQENPDPHQLASIMSWSLKWMLWFVCLPMVVATVLYPDYILFVLFSRAEFQESILVCPMLGAAYALQAVTLAVSGMLAASRGVYRFLPYTIVSLVLALIVSVILVPHYSYLGAAAGVLVSKVYNLWASIYVCRRIYGREVFVLRHYAPTLTLFIATVAALAVLETLIPSRPLGFALSMLASGAIVAALAVRNRARRRARRATAQAAAPSPAPDVPL